MSKAAELAALIGSQSALSDRNLIINGAMQVAQRSTSTASVTGSGYHACDRWNLQLSSLGTFTISQSTDAPAVKSNKTGTYEIMHFAADGTRAVNSTYTIDSANTWEFKSVSIPGDPSGTMNNDNGEGLRSLFYLGVGSDRQSGTTPTDWQAYAIANEAPSQTVNIADNTANEWLMTGVQLEVGEQTTPFEHRSFNDELTRCMRYFIQSSDDGDTSQFDGANVVFGWGSSTHNATTSAASGFQFKNKMRAAPTVTLFHQDGTSGAVYRVHDAGKITGVTAANISNQGVLQLSKSSGFNQGIGYYCSYQANAEL